ncbi:MAG TPA: LuxR C-terminal-related transcriptional regulator [Microlunatus sp.]|nr:LuxR C-terminal-related transcriptional regulator [Microlunatus sp.]
MHELRSVPFPGTAIVDAAARQTGVGVPGSLGPLVDSSRRPARARLVRRLDDAVRSAQLVLVTGAAGAGKSTVVRAWLDQVGGAAATVPLMAGGQAAITVLENFPVLPEPGEAHETLLRATEAGRHVVMVCTGHPALDLRRMGLRVQHRTIGGRELTMNHVEIGAVLDLHGIEPTPALASAVAERTAGWSWGVELAATLLADQKHPDALRELERCLADYLEESVLSGLSDRDRDLLTATSVVDEVTPAFISAVVGRDRRLSGRTAANLQGFVRRRGDGSFTLHPLLRRHLRHDLGQTRAAAVGARSAARFELEHGRLAAAIEIAVEAADWSWAATTLVESLYVTQYLSASTDALLARPQVADALGSAEPVLMAAIALGRCWPDLARRAVDSLDRCPDRSRPASVSRRLSQVLVRMSLARWDSDRASGLVHVHRARALVAQLSVSQRAELPELGPLVQSHLAAFELSCGAPEPARAALELGARAFRPRPTPEISPHAQLAAADCLGMLAWQEAVAGELTRALHHAGDVLTARAADSSEIGVMHAQLATVWCHLERGELEQATQRLDGVSARRSATTDAAVLPELDEILRLTTARLEAALGQHRLTGCADRSTRWLDDQLLLLQARAGLDAGEIESTLQLLDRLSRPSTESQVLRGRAAAQQGDVAAVGEALRARPVTQPSVAAQIQVELLEGWLARSHNDQDRQRCVLDRALRSAAREQLRAQIAWAKPWLHEAISADPALLQRHGAFLATVRGVHLAPSAGTDVGPPGSVAPLSHRELDILQRLGSLSTNEEIATELYLSTNTVKTHLKSLYRKLGVTRRSDAFRRGRVLGLC